MAEGKIRERHFKDACADYVRRISRYLPVQVREVERLGEAPPRHHCVAIDAGGREPSS